MTLGEAKTIVKSLGLVLSKRDGEYRVNARGGGEDSAYYTADLDDAVNTARMMAKDERR